MADRRGPHVSPPPSAQPEQSSVLFSLRELMQLEGQRIEDEQAREADARAREHAAKMEAELRLRVADEAKRRADEDRKRSEQAALREEQARHEAQRLAAIERARLEAVDRARLAELELAHRHEQELRRLEADRSTTGLKRALIAAVSCSMLLGAGAAGFYFGVHKPKADAEQRELAAQASAAERDAENRRARTAELEQRQRELELSLQAARAAKSAIPTSAPPTVDTKPTASISARPLVTTLPLKRRCTPDEMKDPVSDCL